MSEMTTDEKLREAWATVLDFNGRDDNTDIIEAALSELVQANALLAALRAASQWQPIDTAPKEA